jgi:hypothetical protein
MVDIADPEHRRARLEMIGAEGRRWRKRYEQEFSKLAPGTAVIIDIATGKYVTGPDWHAARDAFDQRFGPLECMSSSFDVDRPNFFGGGVWRS